MRRALILAVLLAWPARAAAQQCHTFNRTSWRSQGLLAGVRLDAAGYRNSRYEGNWQGVAPLLSYSHPRFTALAMLPAYRLDRNGRPGYGLGDLTLAVRAPVPAWATDRLTVGFGVAATLPTGKASEDLGMGHVMLMPEFWWVHEMDRVQLFGSVGQGVALNLRRVELSAELQAPLTGAPFLGRGVVQVGYRFELRRKRRPRP